MLNNKIEVAICTLFILNIVGCGGSSGESTISSSNSIELEAIAEMRELVASEDFNFINKYEVTVSLDLTEALDFNDQSGSRAYVSIYGDYQLLTSGIFYPDPSSRVLAGELNNGVFKHSFTALNNHTSYLLDVWFYNGEQPIQKELTLIENNLTW